MSKIVKRKPLVLPKSRLPWKLQQGLRSLSSFFGIISQHMRLFFPYLKYSLTNFLKANKKDRPTIFVCIKEKSILEHAFGGAQGRHFYHILRTLAFSGHNINVYKNFKFKDFISVGQFGRLIYLIENLKIVSKVPKETEDKIFCFDKEDKACADKKWKKSIRIRYDISSALEQNQRPIIMPYPMSPEMNLCKKQDSVKIFRDNERSFRIFFSGDVQTYHANLSKLYKDKLTRLEAIEAIRYDLDDEHKACVTNEKEFDSLFDGQYRDKFILVDTDKIRIKPEYWLDTVSRSDFFLCAPGDFMPVCHNAIEAMAVGTIPIINYPEWFTPPLTHMENAILFSDRKDLIEKIKYVLEMDRETITELKNNVINYYEDHLDLKKFINRVISGSENELTVFIINESFRKAEYWANINKKTD
jgi:hypothetical protein